MELEFFKYEGAGNDFVLLDGRGTAKLPDEGTVRRLCDRHFGIGADGLMVLQADPEAEFGMRYFNADGRESTLCGNGGRCMALFAEHLGIGGRVKRFRAADGLHEAEMVSVSGAEGRVRLRMKPVEEIRRSGDGWLVDTGSPHYVCFVEDTAGTDVVGRGRALRHDGRFRDMGGVNVNFVQVVGPGRIWIRTFERGVEDETLACGTGAVAAALVTAFTRQPSADFFGVEAPGGRLEVSFRRGNGTNFDPVDLRGPARRVFRGRIAW